MIKKFLSQIYPINKLYNIILADGRFPKDSYLLELIRHANTIIACDGAVSKLLRHKITPDYIIGDCDSISKKHYKQFEDRVIKIYDQNSNDLTKAVSLASDKKLDDIIILGATGMREDHSLANISLLAKYQNKITNIAIISDYGIFTAYVNNINIIPVIIGQQISFFTLRPETKITCNQLKWPLLNYQFNSWENGTLNQVVSNPITVISDNQVIVYRAFYIKK